VNKQRPTIITQKKGWIPARGDIIWIDFDPQAGNEIQKRRPAIVISAQEFNHGKFAMVCPITSHKKGNPSLFEVDLPDNLKTKGVVLTNQLRSLDWRKRNSEFIGSVEVRSNCFQTIAMNLVSILFETENL
jgi:mRNA interferase MazF